MATREVALVIFESVQALVVAGPLDVFAAANDFLHEEDRYHCVLVARSTERLRSASGMWMLADLTFDQADRNFHTVLVAGGPHLPESAPDETMTVWLRQRGSAGRPWPDPCT